MPDLRFTGNQNYKIEHIWDRQREIARRVAIGQSNKQIAEELQVSPQTVSNVRNHPIVQAIIQVYRGERDKRIKAIVDEVIEFAPVVIQQMKKIITNDVLDVNENGEAFSKAGLPGELPEAPTVDNVIRAGGELLKIAIPQKSETHGQHHRPELDENDITDIKSKSIELRRQAGLIEDVEFEDIKEEKDELV